MPDFERDEALASLLTTEHLANIALLRAVAAETTRDEAIERLRAAQFDLGEMKIERDESRAEAGRLREDNAALDAENVEARVRLNATMVALRIALEQAADLVTALVLGEGGSLDTNAPHLSRWRMMAAPDWEVLP